MTRMPYVREDDGTASPEASAAFERWEDVFPGQVINLVRLLANDPPLASLFAEMNRVIWKGPDLTPAEVDFAYTTATVLNECHY
jgi:hypothetical protein